jgi:hypothetical protein
MRFVGSVACARDVKLSRIYKKLVIAYFYLTRASDKFDKSPQKLAPRGTQHCRQAPHSSRMAEAVNGGGGLL